MALFGRLHLPLARVQLHTRLLGRTSRGVRGARSSAAGAAASATVVGDVGSIGAALVGIGRLKHVIKKNL